MMYTTQVMPPRSWTRPQAATADWVLSGTRPRASVIIVNYNCGADVTRCLGSLCQTTCYDEEVILVDNASTDGSAERIECGFPWVTVLHNDANRGFGQGNNVGAQWAHGEYLAFLNPDTIVEPGWLQTLTAGLDANPEAGLATSKVLLMSQPQQVNTCGNEVHFTGLTLCRGMGKDCRRFGRSEEVGAVSGAAFAIHRDLFESLGGFDDNFFLYLEDTDLSLRARLAGYRCILVPASLVHHDYELTFNPGKVYFLERNRYLLLLKNYRWRTLLVLLPALLLAEVVTWGFLLLRHRDWLASKVRACAWIIDHWSSIMASRAQTQARRRVDDRELLAACTHRLDFQQTGAGLIPRLAGALFNPIFLVLYRTTMALVRW